MTKQAENFSNSNLTLTKILASHFVRTYCPSELILGQTNVENVQIYNCNVRLCVFNYKNILVCSLATDFSSILGVGYFLCTSLIPGFVLMSP